jgi:hypothetical protein
MGNKYLEIVIIRGVRDEWKPEGKPSPFPQKKNFFLWLLLIVFVVVVNYNVITT